METEIVSVRIIPFNKLNEEGNPTNVHFTRQNKEKVTTSCLT